MKIIASIFAGVVSLIVATIFLGTFYTVDQTQRGVLLRNGAFVEVVSPGLHFKTPWIESVYKIDMQTHTMTYGAGKNGESVMEAYSADQQPAKLRVSVTIHVSPDKVADMYSRFSGDYDAAVARVIQPHVYERVKTVFGQYTALKAISSRGKLNMDAAKAISEAISYDPIFVIESLQIEDISFSPDYIKSVEARMMAEVDVQKKLQNLESEKVDAEIMVTKANGQAASTVSRAKAEADAITLKGDAEARAIAAKAAALGSNPNYATLITAEKWNGALPATMVPGSAIPFLSVK